MVRNSLQISYVYLANTINLDVIRVDPYKRYKNPDYEEDSLVKVNDEEKYITGETMILRHLNRGYNITRKEIYRRHQAGQLTEASFCKVERPKGSGKFVTANIFN